MTTNTKQAMLALINATQAIHEAILSLKEVPAGHLYARVMTHMDLATFDRIINLLVEAGRVKKEGHLLIAIH
jgi:hypothetical protein